MVAADRAAIPPRAVPTEYAIADVRTTGAAADCGSPRTAVIAEDAVGYNRIAAILAANRTAVTIRAVALKYTIGDARTTVVAVNRTAVTRCASGESRSLVTAENAVGQSWAAVGMAGNGAAAHRRTVAAEYTVYYARTAALAVNCAALTKRIASCCAVVNECAIGNARVAAVAVNRATTTTNSCNTVPTKYAIAYARTAGGTQNCTTEVGTSVSDCEVVNDTILCFP